MEFYHGVQGDGPQFHLQVWIRTLSHALCWLFSACSSLLTCEIHAPSFSLLQWASGSWPLGCNTLPAWWSCVLPDYSSWGLAPHLWLQLSPSSTKLSSLLLQVHGGDDFPVFLVLGTSSPHLIPWPCIMNSPSLHFWILSEWVFCVLPAPDWYVNHSPKSFLDVRPEREDLSLWRLPGAA